MSLRRGSLNPLSVLNVRKLKFSPAHFSTLIIKNPPGDLLLEHWINFNLNGRYSIVKKRIVDDNNKIKEVLEIGFEDPSELSLLTLGCPHLS